MDTFKICSKCGVRKNRSEFYSDKRKKDGLYSHCKECHYQATRKNATTEKGKERARKASLNWYHEKGGKERNRETSGSPDRRAKRAEYERSEAGKESRKKQHQRRMRENPEKVRAKGAVSYAIRVGHIPHISTRECAECGNQAEEYHHPDYSVKYHVIPLCKKCHAETYTNPL